MICKEKDCGLEMVAQIVTKHNTIWKCAFNHRFVEHTSRNNTNRPYPLNLERKS